MINKTEALARLAALEVEASNLRKVLEAPEPPYSLLPANPANPENGYIYRLDGSAGSLQAAQIDGRYIIGQNYFSTKDQAQAYGEAFSTMMLLRRQPGTRSAMQGRTQWCIALSSDSLFVEVSGSEMLAAKLARISPHFEDRAFVEAAIKEVGKDRILAMFKTFQHV